MDMNMGMLGMMQMPADFKYRKTHLMGRPQHPKYSEFWCRHMPMDRRHRAKIFMAFDALKGFDEAIAAKEVPYVPQQETDEDELNRLLGRLSRYREAVSITYFLPCQDPNNDAFAEGLGQYKTVTGRVWYIDPAAKTLGIGGKVIHFEDIGSIRFDAREEG